MNILYLDEVNSTNSYSKEHILEIEDKTVICAFKQTAGRGRFSRVWVDLGCDNLFVSIVLKPSNDFREVYSNLTQYTALKLAETFEKYDVLPIIKWPNDILINDKKISGILAETVVKNNELKGIIIGIGINLNADAKNFNKIDKPVTSLNLENGEFIDKQKFLDIFLNLFFCDYESFLKKGFISIKNNYKKYVNFLGKSITINNINETIVGIAERITDKGAIIINGKEYYTGDIV